MPKDPVAPLVRANDKEVERTWEDLETPSKLAAWFQTIFGVDLATLQRFQQVYIGPSEPTGANRGKLHAKTSDPIGIGMQIGGKYQYIYQYAPNTPIQYITDGNTSNIPVYLRILTAEELIKYDLTDGENYQWVIFDPVS